jgi:TP901 family phage tail tape measure protein
MGAQSKLELLLELKNHLAQGFTKAHAYVNSQMRDMKDKVSQFSAANTKAFTAIQDEVPGAARAIGLLKNPYVLAAAAAVAFGAAVGKSTAMALDWERGMAEVNVTAQLTPVELDKLGKKLLWIGAHGTQAIQDIPTAFNRIISAGLDTDKALEALVPTLKAAKAGFTDVETVAAAGVATMKSSGQDINTVYDVLFATLNKGNVQFRDIANYLPKIIPGARNAGFSLQEVGGAFAFLTAQGQTAEYTTTGLMNTFKAFSKPETIKGFKSIGVDIFDAQRNTKPFLKIMQELSAVMQKAKDKESFIAKFSQIGLDQDAVAAVATMLQNTNELKSTIDFTINSFGQLDNAVKNSKTSTEGWAEGWNKVKFLAIEFGQLFVPIIEWAGVKFNSFMEGIINSFLIFKMVGAGVVASFKELMTVIEPIGQALANFSNPAMMMQHIMRARDAFNRMDLSGAFTRAANDVRDAYMSEKAKESLVQDAAAGKSNTPGGSVSDIPTVGAATPNKSIVINVEALMKVGQQYINEKMANGEQMTTDEILAKLNEGFLRLLRNTSSAY